MSEKRMQEQNDRHESTKTKQRTKKSVGRARRRAERKNPESAPKKNAYRGYTG